MSDYEQSAEERDYDYSPPAPSDDPNDSEYEDGQFGR